MGVMVERGKAPPKPGISNPSRGGNRIVEEEPATGNNRNQGTCLGTKLGALQAPYMALDVVIAAEPSSVRVTFPSTR